MERGRHGPSLMDVAIPFLRWGVITEFAALERPSMFHQILCPTGNLALTWFVALVPVVMLLVLLAVFRVSAWLATLIGSLVTFLLAVWVWKMPFGYGLRSYLYGSATGIWAVVWGVILFNTLVTSLADPLASTQVLSPLAPQMNDPRRYVGSEAMHGNFGDRGISMTRCR